MLNFKIIVIITTAVISVWIYISYRADERLRYTVKKEIRKAWDGDEAHRYQKMEQIVIQEIRRAWDRDEVRRDERLKYIVRQDIRRAWDEDEIRRDERLKYFVKQEIRKASDAHRIIWKDKGDFRTLTGEQIATTEGYSVKAYWIHGHDSSEWCGPRDS
ncbi:hypothetical protein MMC27_006029 [Xylographa pallens]|nr:hypothetical protein [Xylographa pallens]